MLEGLWTAQHFDYFISSPCTNNLTIAFVIVGYFDCGLAFSGEPYDPGYVENPEILPE